MNRRLTGHVTALTVILVAGPAAAAETFEVALGLWETTTTTTSSGLPGTTMPQADLSQVPPEYRAQMEAMMKAQQGGTKTRVERSCITKEDLEQDAFGEHDEDCTRTVIAKTKSLLHLKLTCPKPNEGVGEFRYEAVNTKLIKGTMTMASKTDNGTPGFSMKSTLSSKWLGADCGDVR